MRYACVNATGALVGARFIEADSPPPHPVGKGWRWLECPRVNAPAFDPATEHAPTPTYTESNGAVVESWSVAAKSAQLISDEKDRAVATLDDQRQVIVRALHNLNNRVRVLEGQGTLTLAQFRAQLKALL